MKHSVEINAPAEKVYNYLGNSAHAGEWSVFVDHITPLNTDSVADGSAGSRRRCFTTAAETGATWDETITQNIPNKKREIIIYNMINFPMVANTWQRSNCMNHWIAIKPNSLLLFFLKRPNRPTGRL